MYFLQKVDFRRIDFSMSQKNFGSLFAEYQRDALAAKALLDRTMEIQGALETELSKIATLQPLFTF